MGSPVIEERSKCHGGHRQGAGREGLGLGLNWRRLPSGDGTFDLKRSVEVRLMEKEGPAFQTEAAARVGPQRHVNSNMCRKLCPVENVMHPKEVGGEAEGQ